jgi:SAM-dependent methyltransferase
LDVSAGADRQARVDIAGETDWAVLWRKLVVARARCIDEGSAVDPSSSRFIDPWESRARDYDERVARRWAEPDSTRRFVLEQIAEGATLLDIGAGTGAWAALVAPHAACVTAVERSPAMIRILEENLAVRRITNVNVVQGSWPEVAVEPHDFSLCAHAMYWSPDLPEFVGRMAECTRRMCFLLLRAPSPQGIMAEAALHLWGNRIDSPNLTVAENVLRQMGLKPHVRMELGGVREPRQSASFTEALQRMKRHFGVCDTTEHDEYFGALLRRRLGYENGRYIWPPDDSSALIHWTVE